MRCILLSCFVIHLFITASFSRENISPYFHPHTIKNQADTDFYNLQGKPVGKSAGAVKKIKIVLVSTTDAQLVTSYRDRGFSIELPNKEIIDTLIKCFRLTSTQKSNSEHEFGFVIGILGKPSHIVKGLDTIFTDANRKECVDTLRSRNRNDRVSYDVHSHPKRLSKDGVTAGSAIASGPDLSSYKPTYSQPSIILGYTCDNGSPLGEYIGFYKKTNAVIACMPFDEFLAIIRKIKKDAGVQGY